VSRCVMTNYPNHHWAPWKFTRAPQHFWSSLAKSFSHGDAKAEALVRLFIEQLAEKFGVVELDQWHSALKQINAPEIFTHFGGIESVLEKLFPKQRWEFGKLGLKTVNNKGSPSTWSLAFVS